LEGIIMATNIPTNCASAAAITARNAEYTGTPFTDTPGDGTTANPYLGLNRAGGNSPGVGINTGSVFMTAAEVAAGPERFASWTELDQDEAARIPQNSGTIGHINAAATADTPNDFTPAVVPITTTVGADINDTANFVITDTAAVAGAEMDTVSGAINNTGVTVGIGDLIWGEVPVA
jgi:hypothetical protein